MPEKETSADPNAVTFTGSNLGALLSAVNQYGEQAAQKSGGDVHAFRGAIADYLRLNGEAALNGGESGAVSASPTYSLCISGNQITIRRLAVGSDSLGLSGTDLSTAAGASAALEAVKKASTQVSSLRTEQGTQQRLLEQTLNNLARMEQELTSSLSRIVDADMAKEMGNFVREQLLQQTSAFAALHVKLNAQRAYALLFEE